MEFILIASCLGVRQESGSVCNNISQCFCKGNVCISGGNCASGNVFIRGAPVCDDSWDLTDANVLCKEIGFFGAIAATTNSRWVVIAFC